MPHEIFFPKIISFVKRWPLDYKAPYLSIYASSKLYSWMVYAMLFVLKILLAQKLYGHIKQNLYKINFEKILY